MAILKSPSSEILERIVDAHYNYSKNGNNGGVIFNDIYQIDACNHVLSGNIEADGTLYGFIIESGNNVGTEIIAWGEPEDIPTYKHPEIHPHDMLTFIPTKTHRWAEGKGREIDEVVLAGYHFARKQKWFQDKVRNYLYDRHFQPGMKIEEYYRNFAKSISMEIGTINNLPDDFRKRLLDVENRTPL